jgi:myo-inositol-1(or 4)-monophosphatase
MILFGASVIVLLIQLIKLKYKNKFMLDDLLEVAKNVVIEAQIIANEFMEDSKILSSVYKDIKTLADLKINDHIIDRLHETNIPIISEEIENVNLNEISGQCWIIDPLDGTFNLSRGFPYVGISISLWQDKMPQLGVVRDIFAKATYSSSINEVSKLEKIPIMVSKTMYVKDALLATGFPSGANYEDDALMPFLKNVQTFKKIRALGAASLMLSNVASGIFDVYYEKDIYLWDVAAGLSLVKEAGGEIYFRQNPGTMKYEVLASNKNIFEESKSILII